MVPIYVINLDRSPARLDTMMQMLAPFADHVVRIPAKWGLDIEPRERRRLAKRWTSYMYRGRLLTAPEIGCCMSHLLAAETLIASTHRAALVVEDDIEFSILRLKRLLDAVDELPEGWDLVKLTYSDSMQPRRVMTTSTALDVAVFPERCTSGGACLLSRTGAAKFRRLVPWRAPFDHVIDATWRSDLRNYGILPPVAWHRNVASIIDESLGRKRRKQAHFWSRQFYIFWTTFIQPWVPFYIRLRKKRHQHRYVARAEAPNLSGRARVS